MGLSNILAKIKETFAPNLNNSIRASTYSELMKLPLLRDLTAEQLTDFYALSFEESFQAEDVLFYEGDKPEYLYVILEGSVEIYKEKLTGLNEVNRFVLASLEKGDVFGDMAFIENRPRASNVRARTDLRVLVIKLSDLEKNKPLKLILVNNLSKMLSTRLREANKLVVDNMQGKMEHSVARNALGIFMIAILWVMSIYTLSVNELIEMKLHQNSSTPESVCLILFFALILITAMRKTDLPLSQFGITWNNWLKKTKEAVIYTTYLILIILLIKICLIYFTPLSTR